MALIALISVKKFISLRPIFDGSRNLERTWGSIPIFPSGTPERAGDSQWLGGTDMFSKTPSLGFFSLCLCEKKKLT